MAELLMGIWTDPQGKKHKVEIAVDEQGRIKTTGTGGGDMSIEEVKSGLEALTDDGRLDVDAVKGAAKIQRESTTGQLYITDVTEPEFQISPAQCVLLANSTAEERWLVQDAVVTTGSSYNEQDTIRITPSAAEGNPGYVNARRTIKEFDRPTAVGRIDFAVFVPSGIGTGFTIDLMVSSDPPAATPPSATPANRRTYRFQPDQMKQGSWAILSVHMDATADNSPSIGTGWTVSGTGADTRAIKQIQLFINFPGNNTQARFIELGPLCIGAYSKPFIMIGFDAGGSDEGHIRDVLPILRKYGLKASFACDAANLLASVNSGKALAIVQQLQLDGHDTICEGVGHKNYSQAANIDLLGPDVDIANSRFPHLSQIQANEIIFGAPQNALTGPGINQLLQRGYQMIRFGSKRALIANQFGKESLIGVAAIAGDQASSETLIKWLDAAELNGSSYLYLFHSLTTSESPGGTQTNIAHFEAFCAELAKRRDSSRVLHGTMSKFNRIWRRVLSWLSS